MSDHEQDAQSDEFDTVAAWTAEAALDLGPAYAVPAGCRGSGGPHALGWLLDRLQVTAADRMLDCGAGVGGPAAFAAQRTGVRPTLTEPEPGACRAARRLFDLPAITAPGEDLPFADDAFDVAWSIAVLCTTERKADVLRELRRVLTDDGRLGLLVYVRTSDDLHGGPEGNSFPTREELVELVGQAGCTVTAERNLDDVPADPPGWSEHQDAVMDLVDSRHRDDDAWRTAQRQTAAFGSLLADGRVRGVLVALRCT